MRQLIRFLPGVAALLVAAPLMAQRRPPTLPDARPRAEATRVVEIATVKALIDTQPEPIHETCRFAVSKWHTDADYHNHTAPYEIVKGIGNLLTTAGATRTLNLLIGAGGQAMNSTHCRVGVGDSATSAAVTDVDLGAAAGSTHRYFQTPDATFPSVSNNVITIQASYDTNTANFVWNEFGTDFGTAGGTTVTAPLLNHRIVSLGTKSSGTWVFSETLTWN